MDRTHLNDAAAAATATTTTAAGSNNNNNNTKRNPDGGKKTSTKKSKIENQSTTNQNQNKKNQKKSTNTNNNHHNNNNNNSANEVSHYVVTSHPPGSVYISCKCSFLSPTSMDVLIAKPKCIEIRQYNNNHHVSIVPTNSTSTSMIEQQQSQQPFPLVLNLNNIHGNIVAMLPLNHFSSSSSSSSWKGSRLQQQQQPSTTTTQPVFILQERFRYAVIQYNPYNSPYPITTHGSGTLSSTSYQDPYQSNTTSTSSSSSGQQQQPNMMVAAHHVSGRLSETGPIVTLDPDGRCIVLHLYDGLISIIPINTAYAPPPQQQKPSSPAVAANAKSSHHDDFTSSFLKTTNTNTNTTTGSSGPLSVLISGASMLGEPFHCRIEERTVLALTIVQQQQQSISSATGITSSSSSSQLPLLCVLHQDSRGRQHVTSHVINLRKKQMYLHRSPSAPSNTLWYKKSNIDGSSSLLIAVPPPPPLPVPSPPVVQYPTTVPTHLLKAVPPNTATTMKLSSSPAATGGILILGQRQFTYFCPPPIVVAASGTASANNANQSHSSQEMITSTTTVLPVPQALYLTYDTLPNDPMTNQPRYLIGDEFGNLHILSILYKYSSVPFDVPPKGGNHHETTMMKAPPHTTTTRTVTLQLETLGCCTISSSLTYLDRGLCYVGSTMGDSQLIQIHDEPITVYPPMDIQNDENDTDAQDDVLLDTTYISIVDEYINLGPILDFDLVPTTSNHAFMGMGSDQHVQQQQQNQQSQVVTASGTSKSGTIRIVRNGIGMNEYASVEMGGIQGMFSLRKSFEDGYDTYLVQSFVGETRVLGVVNSNVNDPMMDEPETDEVDDDDDGCGGTLEEVTIPGLEASASTIYIGNVQCGDRIVQITETEIRLIANHQATDRDNHPDGSPGTVLDRWMGNITVAAANEAGQIVIAVGGGRIIYFSVRTSDVEGDDNDNSSSSSSNKYIQKLHEKQLDREVSCINLNPFVPTSTTSDTIMNDDTASTKMETDDPMNHLWRSSIRSEFVAVGLWDDYTVRLLSLDHDLEEVVCINLSTVDEDGNEFDDQMDDATDMDVMGSNDHHHAVTTQRLNRNNMMARSLCLITLDYSSSSSTLGTSGGGSSHHDLYGQNHKPGINMLFVGLGDGTLISFVVAEYMGMISVQSKKEVCLGTQCIKLIPLRYSFPTTDENQQQQPQQRVPPKYHHPGGSCVLASGDRPTVIYLAGVSGTNHTAAGGGSHHLNPKLCYSTVNVAAGDTVEEENRHPSTQQAIVVNVATSFHSPLLFDGVNSSHQQYSLCVADDTSLRLGVIDDIQKLHVTTCRLGMAPKRIVHCSEGHLFAVGCVDSGPRQFGFAGNVGDVDEGNMGNCIRFLDETTFEDIDRVDLDPFEMILSMLYVPVKVTILSPNQQVLQGDRINPDLGEDTLQSLSNSSDHYFQSVLLVGTAYALPDEDEPTRGRILVYSCRREATGLVVHTGTNDGPSSIRQVAEFLCEGGVYSISQFYDGFLLASVNSRTHVCQLVTDEPNGGGMLQLQYVGEGHFGHILSLFVKSRANAYTSSRTSGKDSVMDLTTDHQQKGKGGHVDDYFVDTPDEMVAIVGDLMRSISLVQYYPQYQTLEEIARDFNVNWTTAIEMLTDQVYLGAETWNNFFCLRRNTGSTSEEVKCRLDTIGEYHLGEMCNKFMSGSLVMPVSTNSTTSSTSRHNRRGGRISSPVKRSDITSPMSKSGASGVVASRIRRPVVTIGSQTLFGTASGTLGVVLGMDARTAAFFSTLERAMANPNVIRPVGDFGHAIYRACNAERRVHPAHGFVDGDLVESFLDLDRNTMEAVVTEMNLMGGWELSEDNNTTPTRGGGGGALPKRGTENGELSQEPELTVDDVLAMVEEMTMQH